VQRVCKLGCAGRLPDPFPHRRIVAPSPPGGRRAPAAAAEHRLRPGMEDAIEELLLGVGGGDTSVARMARLAEGFLREGGPQSATLKPLADLRSQEQNAERGLRRWTATQPWRRLFPGKSTSLPCPSLA
jgi:alkanesulfonate monooxygenase SsuD/methylene tetrahydromethanopterin reductase-like flavin-dependent oxidoreductase (luciferase family)